MLDRILLSRSIGSFYRGHPALFHADYTLARGARGPLLPVEIAYCTRVVTEYPFTVGTRGRHLQLPDFVSSPDVKVAFAIQRRVFLYHGLRAA